MKKDEKLSQIISKAFIHFLSFSEQSHIQNMNIDNYTTEMIQNISNNVQIDKIDLEKVDSMSFKLKKIAKDITSLTINDIKNTFN